MSKITIFKGKNGTYNCLYGVIKKNNGRIVEISEEQLEKIKNESLDKVLKILEKLYNLEKKVI